MVTVSSVEKTRNGFRVTLSNCVVYRFSAKDLRLFPLTVGQEIDEAEIHRFAISRQLPAAFNMAGQLLSRRVCSRQEVIRKLSAASFDPDVTSCVVEKLEEKKWIDDVRFTEAWIHYRSEMNYGPERIRRELKAKGISENLIQSAFSEEATEHFQEAAVQEAIKLLRKRALDTLSFPDLQKATASLVRKGFDWDTAKSAVRKAVAYMKEHRGFI